MHILLVEPDTLLAKYYSKALERVGSVVVAHSSQDAITLADERKPDVIVLETQIARHNGLEFLYELRSYQEWQDIAVVVHTKLVGQPIDSKHLADLGPIVLLDKHETTVSELMKTVKACGGQ